jgi:phosphoribosylanthranilate isomerase
VTFVKVCGLTTADDVRLACEQGAAWIGINFAAASPRRVDLARAEELGRAAPSHVVRVGVFADEELGRISEAVGAAGLDLVQLHRPVAPDEAERLPVPMVAVVRVGREAPAPPAAPLVARSRALLFDAEVPGRAGGTGVPFEWALVAGRPWPLPFLVGGGLNADNVGAAIATARPDGVDVASGVESAPGIKDPDRLRRFFDAVGRADARAAEGGAR